MSSTAIGNKPGVEVNIWIAKDAKGNYVTEGGLEESQGGRVGHASMKIFLSRQDKTKYSPLMRCKNHVYVSLWPGRFEASIEDDINLEGERPNTIIRLNELNTSEMLAELYKVMNIMNWNLKAKTKTPLALSAESCTSFVYKLLEIGGIFEKSRYEKTSYWGPTRKNSFETNCHLGDILWKSGAISPKLVQHVAASAAESNSTDKNDTLALMKSDLVHKDLQSSYDIEGMAISALGSAVVVLSIVGLFSLGEAFMKK